ncbi:MAG: Glycine cleavage system H protein [Chlamydiales bacterium]|nr:Glycine cleavage system H protein [Chlamydiales bacterium]MCH9619977.1 Glycine cleavage system H protein [Chlamydiales bacterium]MCH9622596.1 Glycine cleavage system H protein [Chlamydiales bacterium]
MNEWIDLDGEIATVGITNKAQKELGEIVFVELPKEGYKLQKGDPVAVLESTKAAIDIYSPLSGEIIETNKNLKEFPGKLNDSPEKEGWIFKIKINKD